MLRPDEKRLLTFTGFLKAFEDELPRSKTHKEAFNRIEDAYEDLTGEERFSSYNSFQTARKRRLKKRK